MRWLPRDQPINSIRFRLPVAFSISWLLPPTALLAGAGSVRSGCSAPAATIGTTDDAATATCDASDDVATTSDVVDDV